MQSLNEKYEVAVHVDVAKAALASVQATEIHETAQNFVWGVDNLRKMLVLPLALQSQQVLAVLTINRFADMVTSFKQDPRPILKSAELRHTLLAEAMNWLQNVSPLMSSDPVMRTFFAESAQETLQDLMTNPETRASMTSLLLSSISNSWTVFECLAVDLWKAAFDGHPEVTAPIQPFSFLRFDGLAKAYRHAFGDLANSIFDQKSRLYLLNGLRNIIVHRGGVVDDAFKRQTHTFPELSHLVVNDRLDPQSFEANFAADTVIDAGSRLIQIVDDWLIKHPR